MLRRFLFIIIIILRLCVISYSREMGPEKKKSSCEGSQRVLFSTTLFQHKLSTCFKNYRGANSLNQWGRVWGGSGSGQPVRGTALTGQPPSTQGPLLPGSTSPSCDFCSSGLNQWNGPSRRHKLLTPLAGLPPCVQLSPPNTCFPTVYLSLVS